MGVGRHDREREKRGLETSAQWSGFENKKGKKKKGGNREGEMSRVKQQTCTWL